MPAKIALAKAISESREFRDTKGQHDSYFSIINELSDLNADDFDMALLGFDADELETLLGIHANSETSEDPPPSSSSEIDVDGFSMGAKCPRCQFEFNPDKA